MIRSTSLAASRSISAANQQALSQLTDWQLQMADGKRIHKPSDDPIGVRIQMNLKSQSEAIDSHISNIDKSLGFLYTSDSTLSQVTENLQQAKALAVQGGNDTLDAAERKGIAEQVDQLLNRLIDLGNTQYDGRYVFAGTATTTKPFVLDAASNSVVYQGTYDDFEVEISPVSRERVSQDGSTLFKRPSDIFDTLMQLRDALAANDGTTVRALISDVDLGHEQVLNAFGDLGGREARLDATKNQLADVQLNLDEQASVIGDADLAEVISRFNEAEVALEAGLQAGARVLQHSLLDYLR
jgi:flagellar hook-associated protein 3 FlgL